MNVAPVSVIVPCYRCANTIERAIASVVAQTLRPTELLLVEDASGDGTLEVLLALQRRYEGWIRVIPLQFNAGAASARNAGWNATQQPYIAFLDADDAWHPKKIEIQYAYMRDHPTVVLSGHLCRQLPHDACVPHSWSIDAPSAQPVRWERLLLQHAFVTPSVMLHRIIPMRFTEGLRHMEDHRLWLEVVGAQLPVVKLQIELAAVYKPVYGASGLSADMWSMEKAELANFLYFYKQGKISPLLLPLLQCYSLAKFLRRLVIVRN